MVAGSGSQLDTADTVFECREGDSVVPRGRGGDDALLPAGRGAAAEAAHPVPQARRRALRGGADGRRRLLGRVSVALPRAPADRDRRLPGVGGAGRGADRQPPAAAAPPAYLQTGHRLGRPVTGRQLLLANDDVRISYAVADRPSPLYRNAVGDECVYVESGTGDGGDRLRRADARPGDYVLLPTSTTHRWVPTGDGPLRTLRRSRRAGTSGRRGDTCRRAGSSSSPRRTASATCAGRPSRCSAEGDDVDVLVRHRAGRRWLTYADHPFDVVGWDGCLYPYAFNIADFEPITGRVHQPPPVHQTFEGPELRDLLVRAAEGGLPPAGGADPVQPRERRLGRGAVLRRRGLRGAARVGDRAGARSRCTRAGSRTGRSRARSSGRSGPSGSRSWRSWSTRSARSRSRPPALACEDPGYAWTWSGRRS